jgi:hypothetical protein
MKLRRFTIPALAVTLAFAHAFPAFNPARAQDGPETKTIFITEDGRISVELPEGWYAAPESVGLKVVNSEELLNPDTDIITPGDLGFAVLPLARAEFESLGLSPEATLTEIMDALLPVLAGDDASTVLGEPEAFGDSVLRVTVSDSDNDGAFYIADHLAPGVVGVVPMAAPKGEFTEEAEAEMLAIAEEIQYALELTEVYTAADGLVSFSHPAEWILQDLAPGFVTLYNSQASADAAAADEDAAPDQAALIVNSLDLSSEEVTDEYLLAYADQLVAEIVADSEDNPVVEAAVFIESESLTHRVVFIEAASDIAKGGIVVAYDAETGIASTVIVVGGTDVGDRLFLTALNIALSATPAASGEVVPEATAEAQ